MSVYNLFQSLALSLQLYYNAPKLSRFSAPPRWKGPGLGRIRHQCVTDICVIGVDEL